MIRLIQIVSLRRFESHFELFITANQLESHLFMSQTPLFTLSLSDRFITRNRLESHLIMSQTPLFTLESF